MSEEILFEQELENNLTWKNYWVIVAIYIISQVAASFAMVVALLVNPNWVNSMSSVTMYSLVFTQVIGLGLVALYIKKKGIKLFKRQSPLGKWEPLFLAISAPAFVVIVNSVFSYLMQFSESGNTQNQEVLVETTAGAGLIPTMIAIGIIAPIFEELVFRSPIFHTNKKLVWINIVITSVLFGVVHIPSDFVSFALYFSLGFVLAVVAYKTNKLEHAIFIHMVNNMFAVLAMMQG